MPYLQLFIIIKIILRFFQGERILHRQLIKKVLSILAFSPSVSLSFHSGGPATVYTCPYSSSQTLPQSLPLLHLLEIFLKFPFVNYMQIHTIYLEFCHFGDFRRESPPMSFLGVSLLLKVHCSVLSLRGV